MIDIEFRGYSKIKKGWIYGLPAYHKDKIYGIQTKYNTTIKIEPKSLGQYTGIKDKKGIKIYEGDIYHLGDINIKYKVVWHDAGLIGKQIGSSSYAGLSYWRDRIEVIGNIYENSNLIK